MDPSHDPPHMPPGLARPVRSAMVQAMAAAPSTVYLAASSSHCDLGDTCNCGQTSATGLRKAGHGVDIGRRCDSHLANTYAGESAQLTGNVNHFAHDPVPHSEAPAHRAYPKYCWWPGVTDASCDLQQCRTRAFFAQSPNCHVRVDDLGTSRQFGSGTSRRSLGNANATPTVDASTWSGDQGRVWQEDPKKVEVDAMFKFPVVDTIFEYKNAAHGGLALMMPQFGVIITQSRTFRATVANTLQIEPNFSYKDRLALAAFSVDMDSGPAASYHPTAIAHDMTGDRFNDATTDAHSLLQESRPSGMFAQVGLN